MCSTSAGDVLERLTDGELLEHVRDLVAEQNRIAARLAAAVRAAECRRAAEYDGLRTMTSWLRAHTRLRGAAITGIVRQGRAVEQLPAVGAAFAAGQLTADQVEVIAEIVTPGNLDRANAQHIDLPVIEDALVTVATAEPYRTLQVAVGSYLARLDPDGREPDPTEERALTVVQHPDGAVTFGGSLDQVGGEKFTTVLEAHAAAGRTAGDTRSRAQRLADALVQLCDNALASGDAPVLRTVKPHLALTIPVADLADPATGPGAAITGTGAILSAARVRWAACDANVTRIVLDPDGLPLDVGRTQRLVPPHLRRAVEHRDRGCVFTGCSAPTWWCDVHHLLEWINGGDTSLDNSALLCERHHTKIHHGYRVQRDDAAPPGHRWRTWRPDGTEILTGAPRARGTALPRPQPAAGAGPYVRCATPLLSASAPTRASGVREAPSGNSRMPVPTATG